MSLLADRLQAVEERLHAACRRVGRLRADVTLVAVTKTVTPAIAAELHHLGPVHLGESRPQELWRKAAALPSSVRWHLIGHLQRNKIDRTLPLVEMIHSVDSLRLLSALEEEAARQQRPVAVLLEVNASGEAAKHGFAPEEVPTLIGPIKELRHVRVCGLMTMAAYADDPQQSRPTFAALRTLRDRLRGELPPPHVLDQLSMGMSNDFEVAVEEGATLVRLGTVLFEGMEGGGVMLAVTEHAEGCVLPVRAQPGARKTAILGDQAGVLKVAVTAPPEDGRANQALVETLRDALRLKRFEVELLSGAKSKQKTFLIRGLKPAELLTRLTALLDV